MLIFLKKLIDKSFLNKFIRIFFNFVAKFYYKFSKNCEISKQTRFVFICYGGLGDCILSFPFLIELSKKYEITVFIDNSMKEINCLLSKNIKIKNYSKTKLLQDLSFFKKNNTNYILIQQSPIMEFMLFHLCLGRPSTVGFIYKQNQISFEGIIRKKIHTTSLNKISKYKFLLKNIFLIENKPFLKFKDNYIEKNKFRSNYENLNKNKYFILSPTKSYHWEMGFLDYKTYSNLIISIYNKSNIVPVLIGTNEDGWMIKKIIKEIPKKVKFINLVGKTSINDLIPIITNSNFVIANDNGIHHLSNFLNMKTLTLYNFSSYEVYNWYKKNAEYIFNPIFNCMPCIGKENGPFDNYPFKCPWDVRCKKTITEKDILKKLEDLSWLV